MCALVTGVQTCALPILPHFADRFRCIAPDQRGYRGSSKPQDAESYTPDKLIADIFALADALGVGQFTIVGHDWGGAIAWGVALGGQPGGLHPAWAGRVTRAVIANARSEEHTSELQSLMRISYAVFCLKTKKNNHYLKP